MYSLHKDVEHARLRRAGRHGASRAGSRAAQPPSIVLAAVTPVKQERQLSMPQATRTSITARRAPPVVREFTVMRWSEARRRCIRAHDEPPSLRCARAIVKERQPGSA